VNDKWTWYVVVQESVLLAVSSRKWTAFGSETDSVSDEYNSSTAGQSLHAAVP